MPIAVGDIIEGRVSGIAKFGAFVEIGEGKNGLVHISEISSRYVENVEDFVKRGDVVKVKVVSISPEGKIGLSIRQAEPPKERPVQAKPAQSRPRRETVKNPSPENEGVDRGFEDKLERFLKESTERYEAIRCRQGKKTGNRNR